MNKKSRYCRECGAKTNDSHCIICGRKTVSIANRVNEKHLYILDDDIVSDSDMEKSKNKYIKEQKHQENMKKYRQASQRVETTLEQLSGHEERYERKNKVNRTIKPTRTIQNKNNNKVALKVIIILSLLFTVIPMVAGILFEVFDSIQISSIIDEYVSNEEVILDDYEEELFYWYSDEIEGKEYIHISQPYNEYQDNFYKVTTIHDQDMIVGPHEDVYVAMNHDEFFDLNMPCPFQYYELHTSISELELYHNIYLVVDEDKITRYYEYYEGDEIQDVAKAISSYYFELQYIYNYEGMMEVNLVEVRYDDEYNALYQKGSLVKINFDDFTYEIIE